MGKTRQRVVFGVGAAVASVGAVAMISAAATPVAHADDTAAILADLTSIEGAATTAFTNAGTDLSSGDFGDGLTQLYIGLDDSVFGIPNLLEVGELDNLQGVALQPLSSFETIFATPSLTLTTTAPIEPGYILEANMFYQQGLALITTITGLPPTDFADTALDNSLSVIDQYILPSQIETIGSLLAAL